MASLGSRQLLRVFAKHDPYTDGHLGKVESDMLERGTPTINVVEWRGDYFATEGSHRLHAAHSMGLIPNLIVSSPDRFDPSDEDFWNSVRERLPHYTWEI